MKIWLSNYKLTEKQIGKTRQGYLLKVQTEDFAAGYADVFPWPEFGDPDFKLIPKLLKEKKSTPLLDQSLNFAKIDGEAREKNVSLIAGQRLQNHYLVTGVKTSHFEEVKRALDLGFEKIKLKVCRNGEEELKLIKSLAEYKNDKKWLRLDCNGKGSADFFNALKPFKEIIEFIEDPFDDPEKWAEWDLPWAYDQPSFTNEKVNCEWQIIKPAKQKITEATRDKVVFTSYLDHPVGIAHAFHQANLWGEQKIEYGLMSHSVYKETPYHRSIIQVGPWGSVESGAGIGFADLLAKQNWVEVI